jgi:hypothetical protein
MKRIMLLGAAALLTTAAAKPDAVPAPSFRVGDSWVYEQSHQQGTQGFGQQRLDMTIERTGEDTILIGMKPDGVPMAYEDHVMGPDLSQHRIVDGKDVETVRPLNFPMAVGQSWSVDFTDPTRRGQQASAHIHRTYKVIGWEDVVVPAGTFHAIEVESSGVDQAVIDVPNVAMGGAMASPQGATAISQSQRGGRQLLTVRWHSEMYYAPAVKNFVKSVEEQFNTDGVLVSRDTRLLDSFHPAS